MRHALAAIVRILLKLVWGAITLVLVASLTLVLGIRILSHELSNAEGQTAVKRWLAAQGITMAHDTFAFTPRLNEFTLEADNLTIAYPGGTVNIKHLYANFWLLTDFFDNDAASTLDIDGINWQPSHMRANSPNMATIANTTNTKRTNIQTALAQQSQDSTNIAETLTETLTAPFARLHYLGWAQTIYENTRSLLGSTLTVTIDNAQYQTPDTTLNLSADWQDAPERDRMEISTSWEMSASRGAWRTEAATYAPDGIWFATSTAAFRLKGGRYATTMTHTLTNATDVPILTNHIQARTPLGDMMATNTITFTDGLTNGITSTFEHIDMVRNAEKHAINNLRASLTENHLRVTLPALPLKLLDPVLGNLQLRGNLANIVWQNGQLNAVGTNIAVILPHLYAAPIPLAYATLAHNTRGLVVHAQDSNEDGAERITMTYANRQLLFDGANLSHARTLALIPNKRLTPNVNAWIAAHLKNTHITTGAVAIDLTAKGRAPTLNLTFDNAEILPAPNYPWLHTENAKLNMNSAGLRITAPSAQSAIHNTTDTATVHLNHIDVQLDGFRTLTARTVMAATLPDAKRYVQRTPLVRRATLAAFFEQATLQGDTQGTLHITTELKNPAPTFALRLTTNNGALAYPPLPDITHIQAVFDITDHGIETRSTAEATMHGENVTFTIKNDDNATRITAHAALNLAHWIPAIAENTTGTAHAQATITFPREGQQPQHPATVVVTSHLEGIASTLPAPLAKSTTSTMPLNLTMTLDNDIRADGTLADMALTYQADSGQRTLRLANTTQDITLSLETTHDAISIRAHSDQWLWRIPPRAPLDNRDIRNIRQTTTQTTRLARAPEATTNHPTAKQRNTPTRFATTPIQATWGIDALRLDDIAMGQTTLSANITTNQMTLAGRITADDDTPQTIRFNAQHNAEERGTLTFTVQAERIPPWLGLIGLPLGTVKAEDVEITGALNWATSLPALQASDLMGTINFTSGVGELTELEPGVLRVVSLLNIRAILRRLQLDIADVAAKGTAFDELKGRIRLTPEYYHIENIRMDSVALILELSGTIHRANNTLDLTATARPILTPSGVSLAAIVGSITALATPLTAGLYALALGGVSEGLDLEIGDAHYHIGGTIANPIITEGRAP